MGAATVAHCNVIIHGMELAFFGVERCTAYIDVHGKYPTGQHGVCPVMVVVCLLEQRSLIV